MKNIKKLLFIALIFIASLAFVQFSPPENENIAHGAEKDILFSYVTFSSYGQVLDHNNISVEQGSPRQVSILANGSISVNFRPLEVRYIFIANNIINNNTSSESGESSDEPEVESNLSSFILKTTNIKIKNTKKVSKTPSNDEEVKNTQTNYKFVYNGKTYYALIISTSNGSEYLNIYDEEQTTTSGKLLISSSKTDALSYSTEEITTETETETITETTLTITLTESITYRKTDDHSTKNFKLRFATTGETTGGSEYSYNIKFFSPVVEFASNYLPIAKFDSFKEYNTETDSYNIEETDNYLQKENTFNKIIFTILSSKYNYTEDNPLYFDINFNAFNYSYTLYSKNGNLVVQYNSDLPSYDANKKVIHSSSIEYLATKYEISSLDKKTLVPVENKIVPDTSDFSMEFTYRGRYEIKIYDNTYKHKIKNSNFYTTSFYIKDDTQSVETLFNNIYTIAQTIDKNKKPIDYIVNGAALNNDVKISIKNLNDFENSDIKLSDIVDRISISYTEFASSDVIHDSPYYVPRGNESNYENEYGVYAIEDYIRDGDFTKTFTLDGYYHIEIFSKTLNGKSLKYDYEFTIVQNAMTTWTVNKKTETAKTEYTEYIINPEVIIDNSDPIKFNVKTSASTENKTLTIKYVNTYRVILGKEKVDLAFNEDADNKFFSVVANGVGNMTVTVTVNGQTTTYTNLNNKWGNNTLTFAEYGKYTVSVVDSMGTTKTSTYNFAKKMNTSTKILIALSSFIALVIVVFIISVRGRVKTR